MPHSTKVFTSSQYILCEQSPLVFLLGTADVHEGSKLATKRAMPRRNTRGLCSQGSQYNNANKMLIVAL